MTASGPSFITAQRDTPAPRYEGQLANPTTARLGQQVVVDFVRHALLSGLGFQLRAGTITTPLVGNVPITNTAAEFCVDAAQGMTIIPIALGMAVRLAGGTLHEYGLKSVGTVSSAGAAFVPLPLRPLKPDGTAATASSVTARVAATVGTVTVTAEAATTTLRHWEYANPVVAGSGHDPGGVAVAAQQAFSRYRPVLVGPRCLYMQIGAATTGPSYYAHLDWLEFPTASLI